MVAQYPPPLEPATIIRDVSARSGNLMLSSLAAQAYAEQRSWIVSTPLDSGRTL